MSSQGASVGKFQDPVWKCVKLQSRVFRAERNWCRQEERWMDGQAMFPMPHPVTWAMGQKRLKNIQEVWWSDPLAFYMLDVSVTEPRKWCAALYLSRVVWHQQNKMLPSAICAFYCVMNFKATSTASTLNEACHHKYDYYQQALQWLNTLSHNDVTHQMGGCPHNTLHS